MSNEPGAMTEFDITAAVTIGGRVDDDALADMACGALTAVEAMAPAIAGPVFSVSLVDAVIRCSASTDCDSAAIATARASELASVLEATCPGARITRVAAEVAPDEVAAAA